MAALCHYNILTLISASPHLSEVVAVKEQEEQKSDTVQEGATVLDQGRLVRQLQVNRLLAVQETGNESAEIAQAEKEEEYEQGHEFRLEGVALRPMKLFCLGPRLQNHAHIGRYHGDKDEKRTASNHQVKGLWLVPDLQGEWLYRKA